MTSPAPASSGVGHDLDAVRQVREAILQAEEGIFLAIKRRDVAALARLLVDDFVYRSPGNEEMGKADFLNISAALPFEIVSIRGEEMRVSMYGDTAVLTGLQLATARTPDGREETGAVTFTDVFVRQDGRWLLSLAHAADLPQIPGKYRVNHPS